MIPVLLISLLSFSCLASYLQQIPYPFSTLTDKRIQFLKVSGKSMSYIWNQNTSQSYFDLTINFKAKQDTYLSRIETQWSYQNKIVKIYQEYTTLTLNAGLQYQLVNRFGYEFIYCPSYNPKFTFLPGVYTAYITFYDTFIRPNQVIGSVKLSMQLDCRPRYGVCKETCPSKSTI